MESVIIRWDGKQIPVALRRLAPGRYIVVPHADLLNLSEEDVAGPYQAIDDLYLGADQTDDAILSSLSRLSPGRYEVESSEPIVDLPESEEQAIQEALTHGSVIQLASHESLIDLLGRRRARR
jgi:hypothetical protein